MEMEHEQSFPANHRGDGVQRCGRYPRLDLSSLGYLTLPCEHVAGEWSNEKSDDLVAHCSGYGNQCEEEALEVYVRFACTLSFGPIYRVCKKPGICLLGDMTAEITLDGSVQ